MRKMFAGILVVSGLALATSVAFAGDAPERDRPTQIGAGVQTAQLPSAGSGGIVTTPTGNVSDRGHDNR